MRIFCPWSVWASWRLRSISSLIAGVRLARRQVRVNQKIEPAPGALITPISPPIISINRLEIAKPKPVPPYCRVVEESAWEKDWKILSWLSESMPMPVSWTWKYRVVCRSVVAIELISSDTPPRSVNLIALPIKLNKIWLNLVGSPCKLLGIVGSIRQLNSIPLE